MLREVYRGFPLGHKINGLPKLHFFGRCGRADCLVMELLGASLEDLFEMLNKQFSLKTVIMMAFQLLDRVETVHSKGLIYRDVKPENFLLGRGKESNVIHLVDFGLATFYRDPLTGKHLPYRDVKTMTGTARYMSIHSHLGKLQSRRDDLESVGYVLVYFAKGRLPWQRLHSTSLRDKYRKIRTMKQKLSAAMLCDGLPDQFRTYFEYVKKLDFAEDPDYEYLKELFHALFEKKGYSYDEARFDWATMTLPPDIKKFNRAAKNDGGSAVSSVDTENTSHVFDNDKSHISRKEDDVAEDRETSDQLADLHQIRNQTLAMGALAYSKLIVNSMSVSNSDGDLTNAGLSSTNPVTWQPEGINKSQGYFSDSEVGTEKVIAATSSAKSLMPSQRDVVRPDGSHDYVEEKAEDKRPVTPSLPDSRRCHCTEACFTEERVSFLCFTWNKRKRDVTYHDHRKGVCQVHRQGGD